MKEILIGTKFEKQMIVSEDDLASRWGSGKARVYATPCMIAFMELTSTECIDQFLDDEHITVGTAVDIKHLKASPIGAKILCKCEILEVIGKQINLKVECYHDDKLIGSGLHSRYIVNKKKFEDNCKI